MISIELWRSRISLFSNKRCFGFLSSSFSSSLCSYRKRTRNLSRKHNSFTVDACSPLQAEKQSSATFLDGFTFSSSFSCRHDHHHHHHLLLLLLWCGIIVLSFSRSVKRYSHFSTNNFSTIDNTFW